MAVTPASLVRHELVGLSAAVVAADNPDLVGIEGTVVAETTHTLGIEQSTDRTCGADGADDADGADETAGDRVAQVPKQGTTFVFTLPSGEDVTVEGGRLDGRPARRTENTGDSKWR
ncbi:ribonuclease P [Halobacteriales archaeon QH_10_67_22]|nr:MAG: ribonuclease P [Halobacteriales archaeon QH_10_67_22]